MPDIAIIIRVSGSAMDQSPVVKRQNIARSRFELASSFVQELHEYGGCTIPRFHLFQRDRELTVALPRIVIDALQIALTI